MMTRSSKNKGNGSSKYETDLSLDNNLQVTLTILTEIIGTTTLTAFAAQDRKLLQMGFKRLGNLQKAFQD